MLNDPLAAALSNILNAEKNGKRTCYVKLSSLTIKKTLELMNEHHYIGMFEEKEEGKGKNLTVHLLGKINKCGVIRPRFSAKVTQFEKWEKRYLPAKDFGIIIVSTPNGIMTHIQAKEKKTGGILIAYCY